MTRFVAEAMARAVEQLASVMASRQGRVLPEMTDVEEALSVLCEDVPEEVAEVLWSLREPLLGRCRLLNA